MFQSYAQVYSMKLYYCGFNGFGQIPVSKCVNLHEFSLFPIKNVVSAVSSWCCVFVRTRNEVFVSGQVENVPRKVKKLEFPDGVHISEMSCSSLRPHVLFAATNGECFTYNGSKLKKLPNFTHTEQLDSNEYDNSQLGIIQVCCGETGNLAVSCAGIVYSIPSPILFTPRVKVTNVACGFEHNLLLTDTGAVFSWGTGSRGQLGHESLDDEESPRQVSTFTDVGITSISAGGWHSAVIDDLGELWSWGWNNEGQLGFPSTKTAKEQSDGDFETVNVSAVPITVPFGPQFRGKVLRAACGNRHTVALSDDGSVWGCGWNAYGQLGKPASCSNCYRMTKLDTPSGTIENILCGSWNTAILVNS